MELPQSISSLEMKIRPQDALYKVRSLLQQAYSPQKDEKFFKIWDKRKLFAQMNPLHE